MKQRFSLDEVKAILIMEDKAILHGLAHTNEDILNLYEEFTHSPYNLAYRDIESCVNAWIEWKIATNE